MVLLPLQIWPLIKQEINRSTPIHATLGQMYVNSCDNILLTKMKALINLRIKRCVALCFQSMEYSIQEEKLKKRLKKTAAIVIVIGKRIPNQYVVRRGRGKFGIFKSFKLNCPIQSINGINMGDWNSNREIHHVVQSLLHPDWSQSPVSPLQVEGKRP